MNKPQKKLVALLLVACVVFSSCGMSTSFESTPTADSVGSVSGESDNVETEIRTDEIETDDRVERFKDLDDPSLHVYAEDAVYSTLEEDLSSDDYVIEDVQSIYISKEYLEEIEYNSQENSYFGFKLSEVEKQFKGKKYIYTVNDEGQTTVEELVPDDGMFFEVVKNLAIGTGVILVCVTVSVVSGVLAAKGVPGAEKVSLMFARAAGKATKYALTAAVGGGIISALVTGLKTGDMSKAKKAAILKASQGFKWGAIVGATVGLISRAPTSEKLMAKALNKIREPMESEAYAKTKFPDAEEQVAYLNKVRVSPTTPGSTRPDLVNPLGDGVSEAIEVKNYDLLNRNCVNSLKSELKRQVSERVHNLPDGFKQRIALDVGGRGYTSEFVEKIKSEIKEFLNPVYENIPITILA